MDQHYYAVLDVPDNPCANAVSFRNFYSRGMVMVLYSVKPIRFRTLWHLERYAQVRYSV